MTYHMYWCADPQAEHRECPEKPLSQLFHLTTVIPWDDPMFDPI